MPEYLKYYTKEEWRAYQREYYWKNHEREKKRSRIKGKRRYLKKREQILAYNKAYQEKNPRTITTEQRRRWTTSWRKNIGEDAYRIYVKAKNFRRGKRGGYCLKMKDMQQIYEDNIKKYGTLTCYLCLKPIEFRKDTIDHKIPLSQGGTNKCENLAIAHKRCNCIKGTKIYEEFIRRF